MATTTSMSPFKEKRGSRTFRIRTADVNPATWVLEAEIVSPPPHRRSGIVLTPWVVLKPWQP
jgi:hypothetical protein